MTQRTIQLERSLVHEDRDNQRTDLLAQVSGQATGDAGSELLGCRNELELRSLLLENLGDGILAHTLDGRVVYANSRAASLHGMSVEELLAVDPWGWVLPESRMHVEMLLSHIRNSDGFVFERQLQPHRTGQMLIEVHSRIVAVEPWGEIVVSSMRDLTPRSAEQEAIRRLAYFDPLTGLSNRTMLESCLTSALMASERSGCLVGLIYMDLDDFKPVNDEHGHGVGDRVLQVIADRMVNCVRTTDTIARVGGDEFIALFPELRERSDLGAKARLLAECVSNPIVLGDVTVQVSVSVGLATYEAGEHHQELISRADHAMYRAKLKGHPGWEEFLTSA